MIENSIGDQASGLRRLNQSGQSRIVTVTAGKGGVGKSSITLGLAISMALQNKRVAILDADLGLANIDVMLNIRPKRNLAHFLVGQCELEDIMVEGPSGIQVIPAPSGLNSMLKLTKPQQFKLVDSLLQLMEDVDYLFVDTAAGISDTIASFAKISQHIIMVVCDEPSSITDAYALMKLLNRQYGINEFKIVASMVRSYREGQELFAKLTMVTERFLPVDIELAGCVPYDESVRRAIKKQKVVVDLFPNSASALSLAALANKIVLWPVKNPLSTSGLETKFLSSQSRFVKESYGE